MDYLIRGSEYLTQFDNFKLVGRDKELKRLISILMRDHANSVILIGPGGVGCTSLCLGIQAAKQDPDVPFDILHKRLLWLDTDGLFSTGNVDEINQVFHRIITTLDQMTGSILIVEDTRDLVEACRNSGTMHFISALLVAVNRHKTQIIFETKEEDLEAVLKCHSDMRELFTILPIEEPTGDNLKQIVTDAIVHLESHHGIRVTEDAVDAAIEYTNRYQTRDAGLSRAQPERAITLLDRALSSYRLDVHRNPPGFDPEEWKSQQDNMRALYKDQREAENAISELEDQLAALMKREQELTKPDPDNARTEIFQKGGFHNPEVTTLKGKIVLFNKEVDKIKSQIDQATAKINANLALDRAMVGEEFAVISGIALTKLNQDERAKLRNLEDSLKRRIFGQEAIIKRVSDGVRVARVGRRNKDKPLPYLFLGPSGVGKTEVAKVLAADLLDDESALTRFDMSEYMEKHAVAKMIGAPPGYEGFEAGGILTNLMRRNSFRVLLFDEIEKAHPDVFNIMLQVLDEGRLTDNLGRTVSFRDAVLIMTTNIGQPHFLNPDLTDEEAEAAAIKELATTYRSEFLNRFNGRQNILPFKKLDLGSMERIVRREIDSLDVVYGEKGIHVHANGNSIAAFCKDQYDPAIGARGLPGFINADLEPHIVNAILDDKNGTAEINYQSGGGHFDVRIAA